MKSFIIGLAGVIVIGWFIWGFGAASYAGLDTGHEWNSVDWLAVLPFLVGAFAGCVFLIWSFGEFLRKM